MATRWSMAPIGGVLALVIGGSAIGAPIIFEDVDGNRDGKITSDEMYVFIQHKAFAQLDEDGNWMITKKEWQKSEPKDRARLVQFSDLDVNEDGQVTAIEFAGSLGKRQTLDNLFSTLDRNGDGVLLKAELEATPSR